MAKKFRGIAADGRWGTPALQSREEHSGHQRFGLCPDSPFCVPLRRALTVNVRPEGLEVLPLPNSSRSSTLALPAPASTAMSNSSPAEASPPDSPAMHDNVTFDYLPVDDTQLHQFHEARLQRSAEKIALPRRSVITDSSAKPRQRSAATRRHTLDASRSRRFPPRLRASCS